MRAKSCRRVGARVEKAEICIPTEAGLLNPHSAYVAMIFDLSDIFFSTFDSSAYATNSFTRLLRPINFPTSKQS